MSDHEEKSRPSSSDDSDSNSGEEGAFARTGFTTASEAKILDLARRMSHLSQTSPSDNTLSHTLTRTTTSHTLVGVNPFNLDPDSHPEVDPNSPKFNARTWAKTLIHHHANSGAGPSDTLRAGVSFRNLNVHGFGAPTDFQKNVANIFLSIPAMFSGKKGQTKIQILQDFEGVVRSGEMLVVLGRPGSGCSTFLKTIAGETHGFFVGDKAVINYQGIPGEVMHKNFRGEVVYQAETDGMKTIYWTGDSR